MNTILITGMGGDVAQAVCRSIRSAHPKLRIIGSNISLPSPGSLFADLMIKLPYFSDAGYIESVRKACDFHGVDLIIPCTDKEALKLSEFKNMLPTVSISDFEVQSILSDKYRCAVDLKNFGVSFAETGLNSDFDSMRAQFARKIAKPRDGAGSRGLIQDPKTSAEIPPNYLIQNLLDGEEFTASMFFMGASDRFVGPLTLRRKLGNGFSAICVTETRYDNQLRAIGSKLSRNLKIQGSINFQGKIGLDGKITLFEINARLSGTSAIRAKLGFNDSAFTVDHFLYGKSIAEPEISEGYAYKVIAEQVFPGESIEL